MQIQDLLVQESVKAIPTLVTTLLTLLLGWFVGLRISSHWALRQKRKESDLEAARMFYSLYGEFFAIWKVWNCYIRDVGPESFPEEAYWQLLERVSKAEAGVESILVRLASERKLSPSQIEALGKYRQGYQQLREAIRDNTPLRWDWHTHPEYQAFKQLACRVALLIVYAGHDQPKDSAKAKEAIQEITHNKWEQTWSKSDVDEY